MKDFIVNHKNFSFQVKFRGNFSGCKKPYLISRVNIDSLYAKIVISSQNNQVKHKIIKLNESPHYKYLNGDEKSYIEYLRKYGKSVGYRIEHSVNNFENLLSNKYRYLEGCYSSDYIICERVITLFGYKNVILDGFHRACILLKKGIKDIPVAFLLDKPLSKFAQLNQYLNDYCNDFLEWYTPIKIKGRVIHERTYPTFKERPEFLTNKERGKSKWDFIIKKNLPNIKEKTICDIGCNVGLFCIYLAQMGAKRVDGFDRGESTIQPTNPNLPRQNVVKQSYFVKNLFMLAGEKSLDKVNYIECDINNLDFSKLKYDLFFSSCVLYHFGEKKFEEIIRKVSKNIPEIFLQTNLGHGGNLAKLASVSYQKNLLEKYGYKVKTDIPKNYNYPVIYGSKYIRKQMIKAY